MDFRIVTRGERLKSIRKSLNLKQEHLSGKDVTRNLISMIETNKAALTDKAAKVIMKNLEKAINEKEQQDKVDIKQLYITEEEEVINLSKKFVDLIQTAGIECDYETKQMIRLLNKYKLKKEKAVVYLEIGKQYSKSGQIDEAYKYMFLANEFAVLTKENFEERYEILIRLTLLSTESDKYEYVVKEISTYLRNFSDQLDRLQTIKLVINKCLLMIRLGEKEKVLDVINEFENNNRRSIKEAEQWVRLLVLKGNVYRKIYQYRKSLSVYKKIQRELSSKEEFDKARILILVNIIVTKRILKMDYSEELDGIEVLIERISDFHSMKVATDVCDVLGGIYAEKNQYFKACRYYEEILDIARKSNKKKFVDNALEKLIDIYSLSHETEKMDSLRYDVYELIELGVLESDSSNIIKLIDYYIDIEEYEMAKGIMKFCEERILI